MMQKYQHQPQRVNDAQRQHCERVNDEEPLGIIYDENKFSNEEKCRVSRSEVNLFSLSFLQVTLWCVTRQLLATSRVQCDRMQLFQHNFTVYVALSELVGIFGLRDL